MTEDDRILIARIGAAHGVRGEVRLIAFGDDPDALMDYGTLATRDGRVFELRGLKMVGDRLIARFKGIADRNAAETLTNLDLYVSRADLPETEDEDTFYHADLIGLDAVTEAGERLGTVIAVPNYGAGDLVEIAPPRGASILLPFTKDAVPVIDLAGRRMVVAPPEGLLGGKPGEDGPRLEEVGEPDRAGTTGDETETEADR